MATEGYRFGAFRLDPVDRRLSRDGETVELNARYLDALILLVSEAGRLVTKDRFMAEVWRGVPVTDEALTQCVRTLRRALGDEAARPRFIETAPKHGYRFIAPVEEPDASVSAPAPKPGPTMPAAPSPAEASGRMLLIGAAGMAGGGAAGLIGGGIYGLIGASDPSQPGMGAASVLTVMICLTTLVGLMGGTGVGFGIAAAGFGQGRAGWRCVVGGAGGGLVVGTLTKLLGLDAFALLFGRSPGEITGGLEGLALGAAVGLGAWAAAGHERPRLRRGVAAAMAAGGGAGVLISLAGGRLMAGSLDLLAQRFTDSRLRLDVVGALFGESGLGPVALTVTAGLEGALFAAGVVGAMVLAARRLRQAA